MHFCKNPSTCSDIRPFNIDNCRYVNHADMYSGTAAHQLPNVKDLPLFGAFSMPVSSVLNCLVDICVISVRRIAIQTGDDTLRMIAARGPKTRNAIAIFWRMVFAEDITIVVMLTNAEDKAVRWALSSQNTTAECI